MKEKRKEGRASKKILKNVLLLAASEELIKEEDETQQK